MLDIELKKYMYQWNTIHTQSKYCINNIYTY